MNALNPHEYLNSFNNFESQLHRLRAEDFNLDRIQQLLKLAGNPAQHLRIVHVAGTKGKGSTCAFLATILQAAGYSVGLYTSPHLHHVNERIRILGPDNRSSKDDFSGSITDEEIADILTVLRPLIEYVHGSGIFLTYFEVLTAVALCYFAKSGVDVIILETGLGGRLDATNALDSSIAVITPISLDHTKILGSTLKEIALEKAGIIKSSRQMVVIAPQEQEAMDIILQRCGEFGINPILVNPDNVKNLDIGLKGQHQMINAATAVHVANVLTTTGMTINDQAVRDGLKNVRWPGRFERLSNNPDVIVDGAHNGASAKALAQTLKKEYHDRQVILVLGISEDKDRAAICNALKDIAAHIILTKASHPRAHQFTTSECNDYFGKKTFEIIVDLKAALERASCLADPQDIIVVTGSLFVVAEAQELFSSPLFCIKRGKGELK